MHYEGLLDVGAVMIFPTSDDDCYLLDDRNNFASKNSWHGINHLSNRINSWNNSKFVETVTSEVAVQVIFEYQRYFTDKSCGYGLEICF